MVGALQSIPGAAGKDCFYPEEEQAGTGKRAGHTTAAIAVVSERTEMLPHSSGTGRWGPAHFVSVLQKTWPHSVKDNRAIVTLQLRDGFSSLLLMAAWLP